MIRYLTSTLLLSALFVLTIGCFCGGSSVSAEEMSCHLEEAPSCCCGGDEVLEGSQVPTDSGYLIQESFSLEDLVRVGLYVQLDLLVSHTGGVANTRGITIFKTLPAYLRHQSFLI